MQKFIFIQTYVGGDNGLGKINKLLQDGWRVIEIRDNQPHSDGANIEMVVLVEKNNTCEK